MSSTAELHQRVGSDDTLLSSDLSQSSTFVKPAPIRIEPSTSVTFQRSPIVIPAAQSGRNLVLCFDGTGDQFDSDNSNVVEFFSALSKDDPSRQLVYYQAGIGTYTTPQIATPFFAGLSKMFDEAIAWNLDAHIMGGYEFLMQNYHGGDRICIFGFSRGAYTARCLAGMIHKVGLLPTCNHQQVPFAYKMYTRPDELGWKQSNAFKKAFSIDVDIEFLGVWDSVDSVGLIPRRLPFSTSNTIVHTFRHALSLDERRAKFKANLWNRPEAHEQLLSITDQKIAKKAKQKSQKHGKHLHSYESRYSTIRTTPTDVEEVWFAGCHCDVGGGSVSNETKPNLARIPLRWMIRECFKRETGIVFQVDGLKQLGFNPDALYPIVLPRPPCLPLPPSHCIQKVPKHPPTVPEPLGDEDEIIQETEEEHELKEALSPIYDQLSLRWFWWILEIIPMRHRYQKKDNTWTSRFGWNRGHGRVMPKEGNLRVHRSVKLRFDSQYQNGQKYKPKAQKLDLNRVIWVD